jgi:hypothetical protein
MAGFNHQRLIQNLNVPDAYELGVIMTVGYPGDVESLPENLKQRERAPRERYLQQEFVKNQSF